MSSGLGTPLQSKSTQNDSLSSRNMARASVSLRGILITSLQLESMRRSKARPKSPKLKRYSIILMLASLLMNFHPFLLMVPATIAASCAFMLPSGTGPNASVLASGQLTIPQMARAGFGLNLIAILFIFILFYLILFPIMNIT